MIWAKKRGHCSPNVWRISDMILFWLPGGRYWRSECSVFPIPSMVNPPSTTEKNSFSAVIGCDFEINRLEAP